MISRRERAGAEREKVLGAEPGTGQRCALLLGREHQYQDIPRQVLYRKNINWARQ